MHSHVKLTVRFIASLTPQLTDTVGISFNQRKRYFSFHFLIFLLVCELLGVHNTEREDEFEGEYRV